MRTRQPHHRKRPDDSYLGEYLFSYLLHDTRTSKVFQLGATGSRLPSFSQPSKMPDGQISGTRKLNYLGLYASKTIGSLRLLGKLLSGACTQITLLLKLGQCNSLI